MAPFPETLVVGLGQTGLSVARYLHRQGLPFAMVDSRTHPPGLEQLQAECPEVPVHLGDFETPWFVQVKRLVVSPGLSIKTPQIQQARHQGVEVLGDIELFAQQVSVPIVAITGSNGKSSVTALLAFMVEQSGKKAQAVGNIGLPVLDALLLEKPDVYVMELSSFQLETTHSLNTEAAVVLNISEDHMDRYDNLQAYKAAKASIYQGCRVAVLNRDSDFAQDEAIKCKQANGQVISFGCISPALAGTYGLSKDHQGLWLMRGSERLLNCADMRLVGAHHAENALAALALGEVLQLPMASMLKAVREFAGLPHRSEWVREYNGVNWYNDSKGTNVGATQAALTGLSGKTVLIAGGQSKGADFSPLRSVIANYARAVVLIGEDAAQIATSIGGVAAVYFATDMGEAVQIAAQQAHPGDNVLLSPACASFDMFDNYQHRGEVFTHFVRELRS